MTMKIKEDIREKDVISEFENRRSKLTRFAIIIGIIVGAVSLMAYQDGIPKTMTAALMVISFMWALIVHVKIWRCPSCNGHLGRLYLGLKLPKYCPHCGIKLIE